MQFKSIFLLLAFAGLTGFYSCSDDDDDVVVETNTIVDIAAANPDFSTLVSALNRTGLTATLQGNGNFTVFAPTDAAFAALGVDLNTISDEALTDILLYHVLGAEVMSGDINAGQSYVSTASTSGPNDAALSLLVEKNGNSVTLNADVNVTTADIDADNGVIHIVDKVIMPLDIVGHAVANSNFSTLVGALGSADGDLVSVLSGDGPFTVFAPVNSAFSAISEVVASLSTAQLATVLTYHVVGGANVTSSDLTDGMSVTTVSGQDFTVDLDGEPKIIDQTGQASTLVLTDVQATNGVIHVLERVIIPSL